MFIVMSVLLAAILFLFAGLWVAFRLPGWEAALGISRLPEERKALIDTDRLRKVLAGALFVFSAILFAFLLLLGVKVLSQKFMLSLCVLLLATFFDAVVVIYRHFDSSEYSAIARRAGLVCAICVNIILVGLFFVLFSL